MERQPSTSARRGAAIAWSLARSESWGTLVAEVPSAWPESAAAPETNVMSRTQSAWKSIVPVPVERFWICAPSSNSTANSSSSRQPAKRQPSRSRPSSAAVMSRLGASL